MFCPVLLPLVQYLQASRAFQRQVSCLLLIEECISVSEVLLHGGASLHLYNVLVMNYIQQRHECQRMKPACTKTGPSEPDLSTST